MENRRRHLVRPSVTDADTHTRTHAHTHAHTQGEEGRASGALWSGVGDVRQRGGERARAFPHSRERDGGGGGAGHALPLQRAKISRGGGREMADEAVSLPRDCGREKGRRECAPSSG